MLTGGSGARIQMYHQRDVIRLNAALTQNQWYDVWDSSTVVAGAGSAKKNVCLQGLSFEQTTLAEDLELRIIADDVDETISQAAAVADDVYSVFMNDFCGQATHFSWSTASVITTRAFLGEYRSLKIMVRKTTANGANNTQVKVNYSQIP